MKNLISIISLLFLIPVILPAQASFGGFGLELQVYPTGIMPGARVAFYLSDQDELNLRVGANLFDHRDLGVQEEEIGGGGGGTLGYRRYLGEGRQSWFLGARVDVWRNVNNWRNEIGQATESSGTSRIVVLQPTAEAGYCFSLGDNWTLSPALGFGLEWNVVTDGAEVGQGPILLLGISLMRQ